MNTSPKCSSVLQHRILTGRLQLWIAITSNTLYQDITFSLLQDDGTIWRRLKFSHWRKWTISSWIFSFCSWLSDCSQKTCISPW